MRPCAHTSTADCVGIHKNPVTLPYVRACVQRNSSVHACISPACTCPCPPPPFPISMEIKQCGRRQFTHSPCFDFIQSTVCIITPVPYANLLGPKYCALTNPSFVFSCYTKHQSHFCTHKHAHKKTTPQPHTPIRLHTHTHMRTQQRKPRPYPQSSVQLKGG